MIVLKLAAVAVALASTASSPSLVSTEAWWERITTTMTADGQEQTCVYETSDPGEGPQKCDTEQASAPMEAKTSGPKGLLTKVTFERRFNPGQKPDIGELHAGDTLLGGQVMALAIDQSGSVRGCQVVAVSGDMPDYGCPQARAERFKASAGRAPQGVRQGFMTILVYGHSEQLV